MSKHDIEMLEWVNKFNVYDLYSKGHTKPNVAELKPYYDDLFAEFFSAKIDWQQQLNQYVNGSPEMRRIARASL
jgi:hypothetical protein